MTPEQLFEENRKIVYYCYSKLLKDEFMEKSREDLIQEGLLALWKACTCYNPDLEIKISTYVFPAVQNAMLRWVKLNKPHYYNSISFDEPIKDVEDGDLTIGDTIPYYEELEPAVKDINEILKTYKKWLVKTRINSNKNFIDLRVFRAYIVLNELISKERVSVRYIDEEYGINRTTVSRIFKELRECLRDEFPTRFKNRRIQNGIKNEQSE